MSKAAALVLTLSTAAASLLISTSTVGQGSSTGTSTKANDTRKDWKVPRTADGYPSFEGVWANNSATPLQRPAQWAGKTALTDAEVEDLKKQIAQVDPGGDALFGDELIQAALTHKQNSDDPTTGNYNQFWLEDRDIDNRTSLIIDPPDGKIPSLTPEAQLAQKARANGRNKEVEGPEDLGLGVRCITFGAPRTGAAYDSYFQITQSHDSVAILQETIHEVRMIPIGASPHVPQSVRLWMGDARGHWEGDTLVVETTNYSPDTNLNGATQNLRVIERFTRVSQDYINWEITWIDPATWTKPWTEMIRLKRSNEQVYEYACHEGNYAMADILAGARAQEKAQAPAAVQKTQPH